jgi:hypothetical protein
MKPAFLIAFALALCGCLTVGSESPPGPAGDCRSIADQNASNDCYMLKAKSLRDAGFCDMINDTAARGRCRVEVSLESALKATTTTSTAPATTSTEAPIASTTSIRPPTTTLAPVETVSDCIRRRTGSPAEGVYFAYDRTCGSKFLSDIPAAEKQTGVAITPIDVQAAVRDENLRVLECFFGQYSSGGGEFRACPRILCPQSGKSLPIGETTAYSGATRLIKSVQECASPETASDEDAGMEAAQDEAPDSPAPCNSTNPRRDYYVKGTTTGTNGQKTDYCLISAKYPDHDTVVKYFCTPNGAVGQVVYTCPIFCMDGACLDHRIAGV